MTKLRETTLGTCKLSNIFVPEDRRRKIYGKISELAASIKQNGLANPLTVIELASQQGTQKIYKLLAGGRRFKACELAEIETVPVNIYPPDTSDLDQRLIELIENIDREDMAWHEEVALRADIHRLMIEREGEYQKGSAEWGGDKKGHTAEDTANILHISPGTMSTELELAGYVDKLPTLKNCESRAEARTMMRQLYKHFVNRETADTYTKELGCKGEDVRVKYLLDSYILGDFFEKTEGVREAFDFLEIDPPYGIDVIDSINSSTGTKIINKGLYSEIPTREYLEFLERLAVRSYDILKNNSWLVLWFAFEWQQHVYKTFTEAGFKCGKTPAIWVKNSFGACSNPAMCMCPSYDAFFYMRKGNAALQEPGRKNIFIHTPIHSSSHIHPTQRPLSLMKEIIYAFVPKGSSVCVPFAGSGVSLVASMQCAMRAVGFDLSEDFRNAFVSKISKVGVNGWE